MGTRLPRPWPQQKPIHQVFPDGCSPDALRARACLLLAEEYPERPVMQTQIEKRDQYRLVAVRHDRTEAVLISNLSRVRAESIRASLADSRAFADIRIEPAEEKK